MQNITRNSYSLFQRKTPKVSQQRILSAIRKNLVEAGIIEKDGECDDAGLIKLFYTQVTSEKLSGGETFAAYLARFWDWNSDYVKGRRERKKTIGKTHVDSCLALVRLHIAPYFKDTLLCDITTKSLEDFMRSFPRRDDDPKNGYSRRTINGIMKVIKVALKHAARLDLLPKNPAEKIELLSNDTRERGILTPAELERLFRLEWGDERGKIAAILAASSGMRLGEITGLQIENLDFERNIIHVLHSYSAYEKRIKGTKSGKPRMIFTDPFILRMLAYLHAKNPHNNSYIFYGTEADKPVTANTMEHLTEKALADIFGEDVKLAHFPLDDPFEGETFFTLQGGSLAIDFLTGDTPNAAQEIHSARLTLRFESPNGTGGTLDYSLSTLIPRKVISRMLLENIDLMAAASDE
jgi:integrase